MFLICFGAPLHAATATAPPSSIEEITVTARRMQESTQTVPMTVTAVVPDILKKENITRPTELT